MKATWTRTGDLWQAYGSVISLEVYPMRGKWHWSVQIIGADGFAATGDANTLEAAQRAAERARDTLLANA
jgi:hypothetical protein